MTHNKTKSIVVGRDDGVQLDVVVFVVVGVFAAYPTVLVAKTLVYHQLSAQTPEGY